MLVPLLLAFALHPARPQPRVDRLVALARLDAAVRYFDPAVATRASDWDSVFASNVVRIADAPTSAEYARLVASMMAAVPQDTAAGGSPWRAVLYHGFPSALIQNPGDYQVEWRGATRGETYRVDMGEDVHVEVPLAERGDTAEVIHVLPAPESPAWQSAYPDAGYRILGADRVWTVIRLFYPYKALMHEPWDERFRSALAAVESARNALEYAQSIAAFTSFIHDSHVGIGSAVLVESTGAYPIGAAARLIGDQLVVTRIVDSSAERAGLHVGDVVLSVDGESIARRMARITPFYSASTPQALRARLQAVLLYGPDTLPAKLVVRGANGPDRTVVVRRSASFGQQLQKQRSGNIIRMLPGNIGYVDLDRLPSSLVDSAFTRFANTKAIILDDRGYPLGTAWPIAPRLDRHPSPPVAAQFRALIVPSPDTSRTTVDEFDQRIPTATGTPKYRGRTVMLVDERTISQAEHTGLFFEAANGTTLVGSPTMGANGDVTSFPIPGGMNITFTGHDVRHADGRQLQRVGLQPQIRVRPTIAGIRAGRDEVLEAAFAAVGGSGAIPPDTGGGATLAVLPPEPAVKGWSTGGAEFRIGADRSVVHGGASSGHITARSPIPTGFGGFSQLVTAVPYQGKRVRFSAYVKTRGVAGTGAGLWMRVDGNGGFLSFDNMERRALRGTTDWTEVSVVLDVPKDAVGIAFGMLLVGAGEAWVDDASFDIVGADVPATNMFPPSPNPSNLERQRAMYASARAAPVNLSFEP